jgi:hypothetical protein
MDILGCCLPVRVSEFQSVFTHCNSTNQECIATSSSNECKEQLLLQLYSCKQATMVVAVCYHKGLVSSSPFTPGILLHSQLFPPLPPLALCHTAGWLT